MKLYFTKPSRARLIISLAAAYATASVLSGTALVLFTVIPDDYRYSAGEIIQIYIWAILLWGQAYILIPWFITFPIIIALGVLIASIRRRGTNESSEQTSTGG